MKFKAGDKVRLVENVDGWGEGKVGILERSISATGTVRVAGERYLADYLVKFPGRSWYVPGRSIVRATPVQLELFEL